MIRPEKSPARTTSLIAVSHRSQRGSFILEALIGILIFSFGVLGIVGLQARSIRHVNDAQYRGEAVYLASSVVAKMWGDDPAALAVKYQSGGAGYDAFREMVKVLPGAADNANAPVIMVNPGPAVGTSLVTVTVFWLLPGEDQTKQQHNYSTTAVVGLNP